MTATADPAEVRAARRRPPGFVVRGPRPAGPGGRADLVPGPDEDLSFLCGDWRIFQRRRGHRWSLDDLLTAALALEEAADHGAVRRAVDLGCGIGSVLMMVAWGLPEATLLGVEAQALSHGLAQRSLAYNGAADRCEVRLGDLRDPALVHAGVFDLVTGTPPYLAPGSGPESARDQRGPCCFELRGGVEDYLAAGARALAPGGRLVLCAGAAPMTLGAAGQDRVRAAAPSLGLRVRRHLVVEPRAGKPPLLAVYALTHADSAPDAPPEPFVVRDAAGLPTPALQAARARLGMPPA